MVSSTGKTKPTKTPLSRRSGRAKLFVGIPLLLISLLGTTFEPIASIATMFAVALGAYILVGIVEIVARSSILHFAKSWEQLPKWKQTLISVIVICGALAAALLLLPIAARMLG